MKDAAKPESLSWNVNGLTLTGLAWGGIDDRPVLALHGWLDNASSWEFLAPHMEGCRVVAPDLTGHGHSDHRSPDASYQIWDDLPEIVGVLDALGWDEFHLLGHSRGAIISMLLASAYPERVCTLSLLDGLVPPPITAQDFPAQLRKSLDDKQALLDKPSRLLASEEEAAAIRERQGLSREAATTLVRRNLEQDEDGFRWRMDPRLQGASAMKLTQEQSNAALRALSMATLVLFATDSRYRASGLEELIRENVRSATVGEVVGHHHFHMEAGSEQVAQRLITFMGQYSVKENA